MLAVLIGIVVGMAIGLATSAFGQAMTMESAAVPRASGGYEVLNRDSGVKTVVLRDANGQKPSDCAPGRFYALGPLFVSCDDGSRYELVEPSELDQRDVKNATRQLLTSRFEADTPSVNSCDSVALPGLTRCSPQSDELSRPQQGAASP